jgi:hypothetical protein
MGFIGLWAIPSRILQTTGCDPAKPALLAARADLYDNHILFPSEISQSLSCPKPTDHTKAHLVESRDAPKSHSPRDQDQQHRRRERCEPTPVDLDFGNTGRETKSSKY